MIGKGLIWLVFSGFTKELARFAKDRKLPSAPQPGQEGQ
jgi:hypothetical protein